MLRALLCLTLFLAVVTGCAGNDTAGEATQTHEVAGSNTVMMNATEFLPDSITIDRNTELTLVADGYVPHFISNGTWHSGQPRPNVESGAPIVSNLEIEGNSSGNVGPFEEEGSFNFYCTIHPGMSLQVNVR